MTSSSIRFGKTLLGNLGGLTLALVGFSLLSGCAGGFGGRGVAGVTVLPAEKLYLRSVTIEPTALAELQRAGVDPDELGRELQSELRYALFARGQAEARDSAEATVLANLGIRNLQAGYGNAGTYMALTLSTRRVSAAVTDKLPGSDSVAWTWQGRADANAPSQYVLRHLVRQAVGEVLPRIAAPRKASDPPPPLHLMR